MTNDKHEDIGLDYEKTLELRYDKKTWTEIELSILKSRFFDSSFYTDINVVNEHQLIAIGDTRGIWYRDKTGYSFFGLTNNNRDNITVKMDTTIMSAKFQYLAD